MFHSTTMWEMHNVHCSKQMKNGSGCPLNCTFEKQTAYCADAIWDTDHPINKCSSAVKRQTANGWLCSKGRLPRTWLCSGCRPSVLCSQSQYISGAVNPLELPPYSCPLGSRRFPLSPWRGSSWNGWTARWRAPLNVPRALCCPGCGHWPSHLPAPSLQPLKKRDATEHRVMQTAK